MGRERAGMVACLAIALVTIATSTLVLAADRTELAPADLTAAESTAPPAPTPSLEPPPSPSAPASTTSPTPEAEPPRPKTIIAARTDQSVVQIDTVTSEVVRTIAAARPPIGRMNEIALSSDGKTVYYERPHNCEGVATIMSRALEGGDEREIAAGTWPAPSPDGANIAFRRELTCDGDSVLVIRGVASERERVLSVPGELQGPIAWSSDGRYLIIRVDDRWWFVDARAEEVVLDREITVGCTPEPPCHVPWEQAERRVPLHLRLVRDRMVAVDQRATLGRSAGAIDGTTWPTELGPRDATWDSTTVNLSSLDDRAVARFNADPSGVHLLFVSNDGRLYRWSAAGIGGPLPGSKPQWHGDLDIMRVPGEYSAAAWGPSETPYCRNSYDPECGEFRWEPEPTNDPMTIDIAFEPREPRVGEPVRFTLTVRDDSRHDPYMNEYRLGNAGMNVGPACAAPTRRYGSWSPPGSQPRATVLEHTHTFKSEGEQPVEFGAMTGVCDSYDPYKSSATVKTTIVVKP